MQKVRKDRGDEEWLEVLPDATCRPVKAQKEYIPFKSLIKSNAPMVKIPTTKKNGDNIKCEDHWCQVGGGDDDKTLRMEEMRRIMIGYQF